MTERQWARIGNWSAAAVVLAIVSGVAQLPGAAIIGPWLFVLGLGGVVAAVFGRIRARRRARVEAEAAAAAKLDDPGR